VAATGAPDAQLDALSCLATHLQGLGLTEPVTGEATAGWIAERAGSVPGPRAATDADVGAAR
jgi:hypothetical protein